MQLKIGVAALVAGALLAGCGGAEGGTEADASASASAAPDGDAQGESVVLRWNERFVEAVPPSDLPVPAIARALAIAHSCAYDAWAAYDDVAVGSQAAWPGRRPAEERTLDNERKAISFAAYEAGSDVFPKSRGELFEPLLKELGYDPAEAEGAAAGSPAAVGTAACRAVLDAHRHDGSNQFGDEKGGRPGVPYSDWTGYAPRNAPMDMRVPFDPKAVKDLDRWQPLAYDDAAGKPLTQPFMTPQFAKVRPWALTSPSELRPDGPYRSGTAQFDAQVAEVLKISADLTEEQKVIARWWAAPNTQWETIAGWVAHRDRHGAGREGIATDVKMMFALANSFSDAAIATWDAKVHFDSVRPVTAIRATYAGKKIRAWGGPGKGTVEMDGSQWIPYQAATGPTPPFGEYIAAHSAIGASAAEVLRLVTGSDRLGYSVVVDAGTSGYEPGIPASPYTLSFATFTDAVTQEGMARLYCGVHFRKGDADGQALGREVAKRVWAKAQALFDGTAKG